MHSIEYFKNVISVCDNIEHSELEHLVQHLTHLRDRKKGRLFVLGVGGSAGNASHAVNDFRKLCQIEAYAPTDNVSELTARINDEGFDSAFSEWLKVSKFSASDAIFVFSVGGGSEERGISVCIVEAVKLAKSVNAQVLGIVGRSDGYVARHGDSVLVVGGANPTLTTPISEAFQALIWHCLVSHPDLQTVSTKW